MQSVPFSLALNEVIKIKSIRDTVETNDDTRSTNERVFSDDRASHEYNIEIYPNENQNQKAVLCLTTNIMPRLLRQSFLFGEWYEHVCKIHAQPADDKYK